uniref:Uncharacterized protein n=1 Tax=Oryza sativa TaxID=4530 RepID=Q949G1_ORYSA|nr:putative protein [Oryza sativa]
MATGLPPSGLCTRTHPHSIKNRTFPFPIPAQGVDFPRPRSGYGAPAGGSGTLLTYDGGAGSFEAATAARGLEARRCLAGSLASPRLTNRTSIQRKERNGELGIEWTDTLGICSWADISWAPRGYGPGSGGTTPSPAHPMGPNFRDENVIFYISLPHLLPLRRLLHHHCCRHVTHSAAPAACAARRCCCHRGCCRCRATRAPLLLPPLAAGARRSGCCSRCRRCAAAAAAGARRSGCCSRCRRCAAAAAAGARAAAAALLLPPPGRATPLLQPGR